MTEEAGRKCKKPCVANVHGICAVPKCRGQIVRTGKLSNLNEKAAAAIYKISADSFEDFFGGGADGGTW